jgi:hypothetical protein
MRIILFYGAELEKPFEITIDWMVTLRVITECNKLHPQCKEDRAVHNVSTWTWLS